ncbi:hypothetical protein KUTeg_008914 [Tegillarca granosa]|uniref:Uncharacterized protein n=1 Tax=Tegillarca granosa TaxID=220873 RepID=A0ABQ9FFB7_TEGGR|nr:hypothetical protein KUTeg_008914 [Tegillarca granosa]
MSASYLLPRSSTPKNSSRALPRIPDASKSGTGATKPGRKLPLIPSIRPFDKTKQGPYPTLSDCYTKSQEKQKIQNNSSSSLPKISRPSRQLPKLPDDIGRRQTLTTKKNPQSKKGEDKKEQLHDLYKDEGDDMYKQGQFDKAIDLYTAIRDTLEQNNLQNITKSHER